jgi:hypothetical protein
MILSQVSSSVGWLGNATKSYFSGLVVTALERVSRRSLHAATAAGGVISISDKNSRKGM